MEVWNLQNQFCLLLFVLKIVSIKGDTNNKQGWESMWMNAQNNETATLSGNNNSLIALWTGDQTTSLSLTLHYGQITRPNNTESIDVDVSQSNNTWKFIRINENGVKLPNGTLEEFSNFLQNGNVSIFSEQELYWRVCPNLFKCDLPGPDSCSTLATDCRVNSTSKTHMLEPEKIDFVHIILAVLCVLFLLTTLILCRLRTMKGQKNEKEILRDTTLIMTSHNNPSRPGSAHDSENSLYGECVTR